MGTTRRPISRRRRFEALEKCGYRCIYCGRGPRDGETLYVDHAVPVARGGGSEDENLVASCFDCNHGKRDRIVVLPVLPTHTFLGWLRVQKTRDDPIGDLARDEERDRLIEPASFKHLAAQLRRFGGADKDVMWAAWHAWRECRRGGKPTISVERDRVINEKSEREARVRGDTSIWKLGMLVS